jgi:hypothetical protein
MSAPNANNTRASRRQIRGNLQSVCYAAAISKHDPYHDRNWSFDPDKRTGRKEPKARREPKPVTDWVSLDRFSELCSLGLKVVTDADILAELKRRGAI